MKFSVFLLISISILILSKNLGRNFTSYSDVKLSPDDYKKLAIGILEGLRLEGFIEELMICIEHDMPDIEKLIEEAMQDLKNIDIKHIDLIIDAIKKLIEAQIIFLKSLAPCASDIPAIEKYIIDLSTENPVTIAWRILLYGGPMLGDLMAMPDDWMTKNYEQFGHDYGDFTYLMLFSP